MPKYNLIATSTFGLEAIVAQELRCLGYNNITIENGRVLFTGDEIDIARCNIWLRTADRVLIKMAEFTALDFEELFQGVLKIEWENIIPVNGKMHVIGKSVKSRLYSVPDCQSIVKKAIIEAMKRKYHLKRYEENGPLYMIEISILKDIASVTIDTSGLGLHKREYRKSAGEAPLRENLAAALVFLSKWDSQRNLADPLCGSGTIAIEAALIGKNMAPGINRSFAAELWPHIQKGIWDSVRDEARLKINNKDFKIFASDIDNKILEKAMDNAKNADVARYVVFKNMPVEKFTFNDKYGCIICNPPYGERVGELKQVEKLYIEMGRIFNKLSTWSFFVLTAHPDFQKLFGKKANKIRNLYNGNMKCYFYQYYGPLPDYDK